MFWQGWVLSPVWLRVTWIEANTLLQSASTRFQTHSCGFWFSTPLPYVWNELVLMSLSLSNFLSAEYSSDLFGIISNYRSTKQIWCFYLRQTGNHIASVSHSTVFIFFLSKIDRSLMMQRNLMQLLCSITEGIITSLLKFDELYQTFWE